MTLANGHNIKCIYKPASVPLADNRTIQVKIRPIKPEILRNKLICNATLIKIAVCSSECTTCRGGVSTWKRGFTASWQGVNDAERIKTNWETLVGSFRCPMFGKMNTLTLLLYALFYFYTQRTALVVQPQELHFKIQVSILNLKLKKPTQMPAFAFETINSQQYQ